MFHLPRHSVLCIHFHKYTRYIKEFWEVTQRLDVYLHINRLMSHPLGQRTLKMAKITLYSTHLMCRVYYMKQVYGNIALGILTYGNKSIKYHCVTLWNNMFKYLY